MINLIYGFAGKAHEITLGILRPLTAICHDRGSVISIGPDNNVPREWPPTGGRKNIQREAGNLDGAASNPEEEPRNWKEVWNREPSFAYRTQ